MRIRRGRIRGGSGVRPRPLLRPFAPAERWPPDMSVVVGIKEDNRAPSRRLAPGGRARGGDMRVVILDDGRSFPVEVEEVSRCGIAVGDTVSSDVIDRLALHSLHVQARDAAMRLLATRPRSISELSFRLRQRGVQEAQIRGVVDDLSRLGYLDDLAFAREWVAARLGARPCGVAWLRRELREKGVAPALIEQAIREAFGGQDYSVIEERNARTLIEQRLRAYHHLSSNARVRRLAGLLERRGFSTATITRVLRAVRRSTVKDALDD